MIKAALFDMDGTMFDTERISLEGWLAGAQASGIPLTPGQIASFRGGSRTTNGLLFRQWFGEDAPYEEVRTVRRAYMDAEIQKNGMPVKPGLFELFDVLREKNIRICVATGTARATAAAYWDMTGVTPYLYTSVCGDEIEKSKPDPETFLKAAEKCGVSPEECLVLEDSPNGVHAAAAAGCHLFLIPDLDPATEETRALADRVLSSLADAALIAADWPAVETADC